MTRFQVHLTDVQMTALRQQRAALGLPMAELLRRALDAFLFPTPRPQRFPEATPGDQPDAVPPASC